MKKLSDKTVVILCVISVIAVLASSFWYVVALTEGDYLKKTIKEQQSACAYSHSDTGEDPGPDPVRHAAGHRREQSLDRRHSDQYETCPCR